MESYNLLVVDDHPTVRQGVRSYFDGRNRFVITAEASDPEEAAAILRDNSDVNIAVVDLALKDNSGFEVLDLLPSHVKSVVLTAHDDQSYVNRALECGADGYITKTEGMKTLKQAIKKIARGEPFISPQIAQNMVYNQINGSVEADPISKLTKTEYVLFRHIGHGKAHNEIAQEMHISPGTVNTHKENIKKKLGCDRLAEVQKMATIHIHKENSVNI